MIYNLCGSPVVATFALPISLGFPIFFSSQTLRGTPLRGSIGRSWPAFYALGRGSRSRQSPGVFAKVSQPEGGKSDDGGVGNNNATAATTTAAASAASAAAAAAAAAAAVATASNRTAVLCG